MSFSELAKKAMVKLFGIDGEEIIRSNRHFITDLPIKLHVRNYQNKSIKDFNYNSFRNSVLSYVESNRVGQYEYKFSKSSKYPTLYSSMYACLIKGILSDIKDSEKKGWKQYFDSFQLDNGLFYDKNAYNKFYDEGDGWGARHLLPHMLIAYERLGEKPLYSLSFLNELLNKDNLDLWLSSLDFKKPWACSNQIFNIITAMQYSRDILEESQYNSTISQTEDFLVENMNESVPVWFTGLLNNKTNMYEAIRGAYHIYPILLHDNKCIDKIIILKSIIPELQNKWGGFDFPVWSTACTDIDAADLLIQSARFSRQFTDETKKCLIKVFNNNLSNQNLDGGFVFSRQHITFSYGQCDSLSSLLQESNMFGTWFRLLLAVKCLDALELQKYQGVSISGYEDSFDLINNYF